MNKYQEALDELECNAVQWCGNDIVRHPDVLPDVYHAEIERMIRHSRLLQRLVNKEIKRRYVLKAWVKKVLVWLLVVGLGLLVMFAYRCNMLKGDINRNCELSITDLVQLGFLVRDGEYDRRGDMNSDGTIDQFDMCMLSAQLAGLKEGEYQCP